MDIVVSPDNPALNPNRYLCDKENEDGLPQDSVRVGYQFVGGGPVYRFVASAAADTDGAVPAGKLLYHYRYNGQRLSRELRQDEFVAYLAACELANRGRPTSFGAADEFRHTYYGKVEWMARFMAGTKGFFIECLEEHLKSNMRSILMAKLAQRKKND